MPSYWQTFGLAEAVEESGRRDEYSKGSGSEWDRIKPLLVGLAEVMPYVRHWHHETDDRFGESPPGVYDRRGPPFLEPANHL